MIAVANTQANDTVAPSSSNGNWVDVAAPGTEHPVDVGPARPEAGTFNGSDANYNVITGTSMASPLVAGLVGLMKSVGPDLVPRRGRGDPQGHGPRPRQRPAPTRSSAPG